MTYHLLHVSQHSDIHQCCCCLQALQAGKQAAAACLAAIQLASLPLTLDSISPLPASALLNSPNAQIPRYSCCRVLQKLTCPELKYCINLMSRAGSTQAGLCQCCEIRSLHGSACNARIMQCGCGLASTASLCNMSLMELAVISLTARTCCLITVTFCDAKRQNE